ncbi:MAG: Crp/Fnr family transcriptional regulator [Chloroflexota bacterium]
MGPGRPSRSTDADVHAALADSPLGTLPTHTLAGLLVGARWVRSLAGEVFQHEGDAGAHIALMVDGLARNVLHGVDGRSLTVRYARRGALLGTLSLYGGPYRLPGSTQAVVPSRMLALDAALVRRTADRDPDVARALLEDLAARTREYITQIHRAAFGSVRQRVARHLLDLASEQRQGPVLMATITQQELADAVGSVREVVVRTLAELRAAGIVTTRRGGVAILAPDRLLGELDR